MRIAQVAPLRVSVPPHKYGGTERIVSNLTEALVRQGHDVTLFASGDSQTSARLIAPVSRAVGFDLSVDYHAYEMSLLKEVYSQAEQFDVIHTHVEFYPLAFAEASTTPTIISIHGRIDRPEFERVFMLYRHLNYVSISKSQQSFLPELHWVGTVHHSVDVEDFPYRETPGEYLAFVGRISPEKRPDRAIEIAKRAGIPLKIAAKIDPSERDYVEQEIMPLMEHPLIEFVGEVDETRKREIMANALALLVPIDWPEPFGMVFIESLACGTPVLTCPCGSVPELLQDGVTGYVRESVEELAEAALLVRDRISRVDCRTYAERRFGLRRMALEYLNVYHRVLRGTSRLKQPIEAREIIGEAMDSLSTPLINQSRSLVDDAIEPNARETLSHSNRHDRMDETIPFTVTPEVDENFMS